MSPKLQLRAACTHRPLYQTTGFWMKTWGKPCPWVGEAEWKCCFSCQNHRRGSVNHLSCAANPLEAKRRENPGCTKQVFLLKPVFTAAVANLWRIKRWKQFLLDACRNSPLKASDGWLFWSVCQGKKSPADAQMLNWGFAPGFPQRSAVNTECRETSVLISHETVMCSCQRSHAWRIDGEGGTEPVEARAPEWHSCLGRLILVLPMEAGNEVGIKEEAGRDPWPLFWMVPLPVDHMLVASPPDSVDWAPINEAWRWGGGGVGGPAGTSGLSWTELALEMRKVRWMRAWISNGPVNLEASFLDSTRSVRSWVNSHTLSDQVGGSPVAWTTGGWHVVAHWKEGVFWVGPGVVTLANKGLDGGAGGSLLQGRNRGAWYP